MSYVLIHFIPGKEKIWWRVIVQITRTILIKIDESQLRKILPGHFHYNFHVTYVHKSTLLFKSSQPGENKTDEHVSIGDAK